jgi:hypothetical protein
MCENRTRFVFYLKCIQVHNRIQFRLMESCWSMMIFQAPITDTWVHIGSKGTYLTAASLIAAPDPHQGTAAPP